MSGQTAFDLPVRLAALCGGEKQKNRKLEEVEGTELTGVEEERDEMSDGEGDEIDGEEEVAATDTKGERSTKQHTCRSETGAHTA